MKGAETRRIAHGKRNCEKEGRESNNRYEGGEMERRTMRAKNREEARDNEEAEDRTGKNEEERGNKRKNRKEK